MRILFVCSSLERGRDGVGDYTRRLAEELQAAGHACALLGLHDRFIDPATGSVEESPALPCLRLSSRLNWAVRREQARAFRNAFAPDWTSVQFVPYGFDDRGFVFSLTPVLQTLLDNGPAHLMFHELWIGAAREAPWNERLTGWVQRQAIARLVRRIKPRVVTTSIPVYVEMLRTLGVTAHRLPLFGNVPLAPLPADEAAEVRWTGLFFGALHAQWEPEPLLSYLLSAAERAGRRLALVQVGRMGEPGESIWQKLEKDYGDRIVLSREGEQPAEHISRLLQKADFGVAASPWQLIGKSGSVAAMIDHGLPVIVSRDDYHWRGKAAVPGPDERLLHRCQSGLEDQLARGLPREAPRPRLPEIATRFCALLENAFSGPASSLSRLACSK